MPFNLLGKDFSAVDNLLTAMRLTPLLPAQRSLSRERVARRLHPIQPSGKLTESLTQSRLGVLRGVLNRNSILTPVFPRVFEWLIP